MGYPVERSNKVQFVVDKLANYNVRGSILGNVCVQPPMGCGEVIRGFKDTVSRKEFEITGMCQTCQDAVFDAIEEDEDD